LERHTRPETTREGFGLTTAETDRRVRLIKRVLTILEETLAVYPEWRRLVVGNLVIGVQAHRRMVIEEQFRDAKGSRFRLKLKWTQFTKPEFVERMYLLVGIALLLWTSVGRAVKEQKPKVRLESKRKGRGYHWRASALITGRECRGNSS
jgi:hypothetical protein